MSKNERLETAREQLREWMTFIEDKVLDTAPGQCIDIDAVVCTKLDYLNDIRPCRQCLDGYALTAFDKMVDMVAAMQDEHTILAGCNAIQTAHEELTKLILQGVVKQPDTQNPLDAIVIDLSLFYGDRNKGYDFIDELRQLEGRGSIIYQTTAEAGKAALRIRKRLKDHSYIAVKIAKDGKKVKLADGVAIRFK